VRPTYSLTTDRGTGRCGPFHSEARRTWHGGDTEGSPTEQAASKCIYLVTRSRDPTGVGKTRWTMRWKPAINAFAITSGDRFPAAETR
jgi:hypothetical protein